MNNMAKPFGELVRHKRETLKMSQAGLASKLDCPQPTVSRLEQGQRSATLQDLFALAKAFNCSVSDILTELETTLGKPAGKSKREEPTLSFSPAFHTALASEAVALSQLAAYGVRFLGSSTRPAVFKLSLEETVLAVLNHAQDPRVFEPLPSLLLQHAQSLDWGKLASGASAFQLQNRLGAVVAAALQLKKLETKVPEKAWETLQAVHDKLAEAKLDREDYLGFKPKTQEALRHLFKQTPSWMRFWHLSGSVSEASMHRHLPQ